jgi:translin
MAHLDSIEQKIRAALAAKNAARERALTLSREVIRTSANTIRTAHRGELETAREMLEGARRGTAEMREALREHSDLYGAGYVHDCQKEVAEAASFLAVVSGAELPDPDDLGVEYAAFLNGLGECVGEVRRHTLDVMRRGDLQHAERLLATMDEIYFVLVTMDYPDALTGGLRRTTDGVRGIIEKTRGELTTALRQEELRQTIQAALRSFQPGTAAEREQALQQMEEEA